MGLSNGLLVRNRWRGLGQVLGQVMANVDERIYFFSSYLNFEIGFRTFVYFVFIRNDGAKWVKHFS